MKEHKKHSLSWVCDKFIGLLRLRSGVSNSPELLSDIHTTLMHVKATNEKLVGGIYASSGFSNQDLVSDAVYFAFDCLASVKDKQPDNELVPALLMQMKTRKAAFEQSRYDPDGIVPGTLVDIENALNTRFKQTLSG